MRYAVILSLALLMPAGAAQAIMPLEQSSAWRMIEFHTEKMVALQLFTSYDGPTLAEIFIIKDGSPQYSVIGGGTRNRAHVDLRADGTGVGAAPTLVGGSGDNASIVGVILEPGQYTAIILVAGEVERWSTYWVDWNAKQYTQTDWQVVRGEGPAFYTHVYRPGDDTSVGVGVTPAGVGARTGGQQSMSVKDGLLLTTSPYHDFLESPQLEGPVAKDCGCTVVGGPPGDYTLSWNGPWVSIADIPFMAWADVKLPE